MVGQSSDVPATFAKAWPRIYENKNAQQYLKRLSWKSIWNNMNFFNQNHRLRIVPYEATMKFKMTERWIELLSGAYIITSRTSIWMGTHRLKLIFFSLTLKKSDQNYFADKMYLGQTHT